VTNTRYNEEVLKTNTLAIKSNKSIINPYIINFKKYYLLKIKFGAIYELYRIRHRDSGNINKNEFK